MDILICEKIYDFMEKKLRKQKNSDKAFSRSYFKVFLTICQEACKQIFFELSRILMWLSNNNELGQVFLSKFSIKVFFFRQFEINLNNLKISKQVLVHPATISSTHFSVQQVRLSIIFCHSIGVATSPRNHIEITFFHISSQTNIRKRKKN